MRYPRLKPVDTESVMHVYNRVVGSAGEFQFQDAEKEQFLRRLNKVADFYVIDVLAYQCMGNHFHLLLHVPAEPPSNAEAAQRYARYYGGKRSIDPESEKCTRLALKLRDVSAFMADLEQPFTRWFNRTRPVRRRGHLWAERLKSTLLENGLAVWDCWPRDAAPPAQQTWLSPVCARHAGTSRGWKYIEMNPVRARMVPTPADYRFCSFGRWAATGRHPFADAIGRVLLPVFRGLLHVESLADIRIELQKEFARISATEARQAPDRIDAAMAVAAEREPFSTRVDRRVRYWVDGLVIGSELFVKATLVQARGQWAVGKRRLVRAVNGQREPQPLYSFRQLRVLLR